VAKKFSGRGAEAEDLFQIGAIGLVKCIDKFDPGFGVKFSTYAVPMILGEIKRYLRDDGMIKVSRPLKELAVKAKYAAEELGGRHGRSPTIEELARALNADVSELITALEAGRGVESLNAAVHQGDGGPVCLIDKLSSRAADSRDPGDEVALKDLIERLGPKERQVIILRYFQDKTQAEVAKAIGVSQVQVSRIEKRVLGAMREEMMV
jgi:RNA polymerase sporulation-specific sigma factor